jgi:hypothetical protein
MKAMESGIFVSFIRTRSRLPAEDEQHPLLRQLLRGTPGRGCVSAAGGNSP